MKKNKTQKLLYGSLTDFKGGVMWSTSQTDPVLEPTARILYEWQTEASVTSGT